MFDDGDQVDEGSTAATVMAEKTEHEIPSPASGTLRLEIKADQAVTPGAEIGTVE